MRRPRQRWSTFFAKKPAHEDHRRRQDQRRRGKARHVGAVAAALRGLGALVSEGTVRDTVAALRRESSGAGPLEPLLAMRGVTDVLVNGHRQVFVDRGAGLEPVEGVFADEEEVRRLAVRLAAAVGRRLVRDAWGDAGEA